MGQILLAVSYISLLCWFWGYLAFRVFAHLAGEKASLPVFPLLCLTGLAFITPVAGALSLCLPLGGLAAQVIIAAPAMLCGLLIPAARDAFAAQSNGLWKGHRPGNFLLLLMLIMIGVMGACIILHPDTLGYHAQTIRWIEAYRVIPGLVHLHARYGYQGNWFVLCALFSFRFTGTPALTFLNLSVLCWFLLFLVGHIQMALRKPDAALPEKVTALLGFLLLVVCFCDFGQLRLTAVSASPDFISGIFIWAAFYVLTTGGRCTAPATHWLLAAFLGMIAITIKLSSLPLVGLFFYAILRLFNHGKTKACMVLAGLACIIFLPFTARNVVTSGYMVFPATTPNLFQPDWKFDLTKTLREKQYIQAYARVGAMVNRGDPPSGITEHISNWLPRWWPIRSLPEKVWLTAAAVCLLAAIILSRRILSGTSSEFRAGLLITLAGICFWWWQAPDPRFAYGFLLALPGFLLYRLAMLYAGSLSKTTIFLYYGMMGLMILAGAYTVFRLQHNFAFKNLWAPAGVYRPAYKQVIYRNMRLNVPEGHAPCAGTPLPCSDQQPDFVPRGKDLQKGFKGMNEGHKQDM